MDPVARHEIAEHEVAERERAFLDLVATASHDLRAPVRNARQGASWLHEAAGEGDDLHVEALGLIETSLDRMEETVSGLARLGRVLAAPNARRRVELAEVVGEAAGRVRAERLAQGVPEASPAVVVSCGPLAPVQGDHQLLVEALVPLIDNAWEYRDPSRPPEVRIGAARTPSEVVVEVADNGIGIEPAHREAVFAALRRLHAYHEHPGIGMGLAVARAAVEAQGGTLQLASSSPAGTTFEIRLPSVDSNGSDVGRWDPVEVALDLRCEDAGKGQR